MKKILLIDDREYKAKSICGNCKSIFWRYFNSFWYAWRTRWIITERRRLFEIIHDTNDLIHAELLHDKYDEIMHLLAELKDYTEFHFRYEENLMERIHYPEISAQKRAHAAFVERLVEVDLTDLDEMDDNQQEYLIDLINFLSGWLINHILGSDKKIGEYMREHGIKEE